MTNIFQPPAVSFAACIAINAIIVYTEDMTNTETTPMASLTVRGIPEAEKEALRVRAAKHGRSMEAELRRIIHEALKKESGAKQEVGLATAIRHRFAPYGGVDLPEHPPVTARQPPRFS